MKPGSIAVLVGLAALVGCQKAPTVTGATVTVGDLSIQDGVAWGLASSRSSTVGFRVSVATADTLVGVESPDGLATMHTTANGQMVRLATLPVAGGATEVLGGGGAHIMLTDATHGFAAGDSVRIVLQWVRSGRVAFSVPLKNYSDASGLLDR